MIENRYVVLDVETNGLSSINDDLLSISIYKPDDGKIYNRFLPLELQSNVYTTYINGITKKDLKDKQALSQEEVNDIIKEFELENRTILIYGSIDEKFIKNYLKRKKLYGFEKMKFLNFKHNIISSKFSNGIVTKDNLCRIYNIENVTEIHSGINDCILEWKLFKKMDGNKLIITGRDVFEFNSDYIIPISYLSNFPNFKYCINNLPKIGFTSRIIKEFKINKKNIKKFSTNISGITIEHLINTMLNVEKINSELFLLENKRKLRFIGKLPSPYEEILISFSKDGTVKAVNKKDENVVNDVNVVTNILKKELKPLLKYVANDIFKNEKIYSQELVINKEKNILAKCDLSTQSSVLEIKTNSNLDINPFKEQLFYESNGRNCFLLQIDWFNSNKYIKFIISKVNLFEVPKKQTNIINIDKKEILQRKINNKNIIISRYDNDKNYIEVKCTNCNHEWDVSKRSIISKPYCPNCQSDKFIIKKQNILTPEEKQKIRCSNYENKINKKSNGKIKVLLYTNSRENAKVRCLVCGHEWSSRADHILERCKCPICSLN